MMKLYNVEAECVFKNLPLTENDPVVFKHTTTCLKVQAVNIDSAIKSAYISLGEGFTITRVSEDCSQCIDYRPGY